MPRNLATAAVAPVTDKSLNSPLQPASMWSIWLAMALIAVATFLAYSGCLDAGFVFDDAADVLKNATIRRLWPAWNLFLVEQQGEWRTLTRPVVNFSFALNYAVAGFDPLVYHLTNILIHIFAGWTLFGIVRRTLRSARLRDAFGGVSTPLALVVALVWSLHPLNTQAVAYVTQRYESLMGLFYLLAIYCAIRGASSARARAWRIATVLATLLALGSKEVAVSLPIVILLYDRAFLAGSFSAAWRRRRGMYLGLLADWFIFFNWQRCGISRASWAGAELPFTSFEYALSEPGVILHYLRLAVWPYPLVLDYAWPVARTWADILPGVLVVGLLLGATLYALVRRPQWGVLGAAFFLILAPTSSVMPLRDLAVEQRMYLPLTLLVTAGVMLGYLALKRVVSNGRDGAVDERARSTVAVVIVGALSIALATLTWIRTQDYRSELTIWADTVEKAPGNARAHYNLGIQLAREGHVDAAMPHYIRALELEPEMVGAYFHVGVALVDQRRFAEAIAYLRQALRIRPDYGDAHNSLGLALANLGQTDEAVAEYGKAIELADSAEAHSNLGAILLVSGRADEAILQFQRAIEIMPEFANAHNNLGRALASRGRFVEAIEQHRRAIAIRPEFAFAELSWGDTLVAAGQSNDAVAHYHRCLALEPQNVEAHIHLAEALLRSGENAAAMPHWSEAVRLQPDNVALLTRLAWILATNPDSATRSGIVAAQLAERAVSLSMNKDAWSLRALAAAQAEIGNFSEALNRLDQAISVAEQQGNVDLTQSLRRDHDNYIAGSAVRESGSAPASQP